MNQERFFSVPRKFLYLVGALTALFVISVSIWLYQSSLPKTVQFVNNGETTVVKTKAKTIEAFLQEQSINLTSYDQISPAKEDQIKNGLTITLEEKWPVVINQGKEKQTVVTNKKIVQDVLKEQGIELGSLDKVSPNLAESISSNEEISITKVEEKSVEESKAISFREVKRPDLLLPNGQEKVVQEGKDGKAVLRYQVVYENGEEVSRKLVDTQVVEPMQEKIIKVGTLTTVSRGGVDFTARKTLDNVTLTAYGPTGNSHTASGRMPTSGRTIAADPNVIPMGTWVYIEGYGLRRAEDTGSRIVAMSFCEPRSW